MTLNQPGTCFWTTPNLHWENTSCQNEADMLLQDCKMRDSDGSELTGQACKYKTITKEECLHHCQQNSKCNEFEFVPNQHTTSFNCKLFKAVTFDERCAKADNTANSG